MSSLPASRVEVYEVTVPWGTTSDAPYELETHFADGELVGVEILFPDGCSGEVGVQLAVGGSQSIPTTRGAWLIANGETINYDLVGQANNGAWSVLAYNTDVYDHTVHVRYLVADFRYLGPAPATSAAALPALA